MQNFTLWGVIDASDLRVDHKKCDGEHMGYPSTTVSAFGLSYNWGNGGWKRYSGIIISDHFRWLQRLLEHHHRLISVQLKLYEMVYQKASSLIKVGILKVTLYQSLNWQKYENYILVHAFWKQMGKVNGSIIH